MLAVVGADEARRVAARVRKRSRRSSCAGAAAAPRRTGARRNTSRQPWRFTELCYNRAVKPLPLAVLDRYIMRELVSPFVLGVTLFTFFLVLDRIYNLTELVIAKGVPSTSSCNSWCSCCPRSWPTRYRWRSWLPSCSPAAGSPATWRSSPSRRPA